MLATARARVALELTTDHVDGNTLNNHPNNLVPTCRTCNKDGALAGNPRIFGQQTLDRAFVQAVATVGKLAGWWREHQNYPRERAIALPRAKLRSLNLLSRLRC